MAVIRSIQARQGLDRGSAPNLTVSNPVGDSLQRLGNAVSNAALTSRQNQSQEELANLKQTNDIAERAMSMSMQNSEFRANQNLIRMQDALGEEYNELLSNTDPSGEGFSLSVDEAYKKRSTELLEAMPEGIRPKFEQLVESGRSKWLAEAAKTERTQRENWFRKGINETTDNLLIKIDSNPEQADGVIAAGITAIEASGLPENEKAELKKGWRQLGVETRELAKVRDNPEYAKRYIGGSAGMAFSMPSILAAIEFQESRGNPNAVSPKGAAGLMQVMPNTGGEIATEIGDNNYPHGASIAEQQEYLKLPNVSRRYGSYYFEKMLKAYDGDIVGALAAYNAGPGRVGTSEEWQASGRDLSRLPKETQNYVRTIMGRLGGGAEQVSINGELDVSNFPIMATDGRKIDLDNVAPDVKGRFQQLQASLGRVVTINSGYRDPEHNQKAGGASKSKHMDGQALDLNVADMTKAERVDLIRKASALGFNGIGVYENTIHLDTGSRRYWGPDHSSGSLPGWAKEAINGHMNGSFGAVEIASATEVSGQGPVGYAPVSIPDGLTFKGYTKVRQQAVASLSALQQAEQNAFAAMQANQKAANQARVDALGLGIETREITDPNVILSDQTIDDGQKTTLMKALRARQGDDAVAVSKFQAGEFTANPFDTENRKASDAIYDSLSKDIASNDDRQALAASITRATGSAPQAVHSGIRNALAGKDQEAAGAALAQAQALLLANRNAFEGRDGAAQIKEDVAVYEGALSRGLSKEDAAKRVLSSRDPEEMKARSAILGDKEVKNLVKSEATSARIADFMDLSSLPFTEPRVGVDRATEAIIVDDYRQMYEDALVKVKNPDDARSIARDQFKKIYGVSQYSSEGGGVVMRNPVENYYPTVGQGHSYIGNQLIKDLKGVGIDVEKGRAWLKPDELTNAQAEAGQLPTYRVIYWAKDSDVPELHPQRFGMGMQEIQQLGNAKVKTDTVNAREIETENRKRKIIRNSEDGGRSFSQDSFLDGPIMKDLPGDQPVNLNPTPAESVKQKINETKKTGAALRRQNRQRGGQ